MKADTIIIEGDMFETIARNSITRDKMNIQSIQIVQNGRKQVP